MPGNFRYCGLSARRGSAARLRQRRRDQTARHVGRERDGAADGRAHGGQAGAAKKAAAIDAGLAAENRGVGALGVLRVQFFDGTLDFSGIVASQPSPLSIDRGLEFQPRGPFLAFKIVNESALSRNGIDRCGVLLWCGAKVACKLMMLRA